MIDNYYVLRDHQIALIHELHFTYYRLYVIDRSAEFKFVDACVYVRHVRVKSRRRPFFQICNVRFTASRSTYEYSSFMPI